MAKVHASLMTEIAKILKENKDVCVTENVDMAAFTSFRAGGRAALMAEAKNPAGLCAILRAVDSCRAPHIVLGNGSNTLFKDSGYDGVVVRLAPEGFAAVTVTGAGEGGKSDARGAGEAGSAEVGGDSVYVRAGAAVLLSSLARTLLNESLSGFEFASGIPGSFGGALFMNAGAYGGEMKDIVESVQAVCADGSAEKIFSAPEMDFSYRRSALQENGYIAVSAVLRLERGRREEIASRMKELAEKRNSKQPVSFPSAGSTFKRPPGHFAGQLIEKAGLKGVAVGGAQVSTLHSGFIINRGGATATDILQLITLVQNRVYDETGVMLEPEVRIIG